MARPGWKVRPARKVLKACKANEGSRVRRALPDRRDAMVLAVRQAMSAPRVLPVRRASQVPKAPSVRLARPGYRGSRDPLAPRDLPERQEGRVRRARPARKVTPG